MPERRRKRLPKKIQTENGEELSRSEWLHQQTVAGVEKLATEGGWKSFLDMKARLHRYSFNNVLLVLMQDPDATLVASYTDWTKKFKRQVLSQADGGQPLYIFAPHTRWVTEVNEQTGKEEKAKRTGFHATHCYDVKSTTGPELPPAPTFTSLEGEAPQALRDGLIGWLAQEGYVVEITDLPKGLYGDTSPKGIVRINQNLSPLGQVATLLHEGPGHVANGHIEDIESYRTHRGVMEVESECTAYIVGTALGLDLGTTSFEYIASWSRANPDMVAATAEKVCKTADRIIDVLAPDLAQEIAEGVGLTLES